jgi:hypothetical protein
MANGLIPGSDGAHGSDAPYLAGFGRLSECGTRNAECGTGTQKARQFGLVRFRSVWACAQFWDPKSGQIASLDRFRSISQLFPLIATWYRSFGIFHSESLSSAECAGASLGFQVQSLKLSPRKEFAQRKCLNGAPLPVPAPHSFGARRG